MRTIASLGFMTIALAIHAQQSSIEDVIELLKARPISESYTADIEMDMTAAGMQMSAEGTLANHGGAMKLVADINAGGQAVKSKVVIDENGKQWMETQMASGFVQVLAVDTKMLRENMGDAGEMDLSGESGVLFRPTPRMYERWSERMDLTLLGEEEVDNAKCWVISGTYKEEFFANLEDDVRSSGNFPDTTIFHIAQHNSFPVQVRVESDAGPNGMIRLTNVDLEPEFAEGEFTYFPPEGATVVDMTELMRQQTGAGPPAQN